MNKKLILSLMGILSASIYNYNNIFITSEATSINKQEDLSPLITYSTEKIGDREKIRVTVTIEDRSGTGIKEFRDYNNKLISTDTYTFETTKRGNYLFTVIDNNNNESSIKIDDTWINPLMSGNRGTKLNGSAYWSSSSLREWLNSDKLKVDYTCNPPSDEFMDNYGYDDESGFLYEFTEEEKNAIAVTERRVHVDDTVHSLSKEGGVKRTPHPNQYGGTFLSSYANYMKEYFTYSYKRDNDKVFLLNTGEMYWYLNRRNFSYRRPLTNAVKQKYNIKSEVINWWIQGSGEWSDVEWIYCAESSNSNLIGGVNVYPYHRLGVVPALNVKPDYVFSNGLVARDLNIGDKIVFGRYLNQPITWEVINISNQGYPLLLSTEALELRKFDAKGDLSRVYSDVINYDTYDTSMLNDLEYKTTSGDLDVDIPKMRVVDETPLNTRQNNEFTLLIEAEDIGGSGIKYIELPNSNKITQNQFEYTFNKNNNYIFKIMDNAGNYTDFMIPVTNINQEPIVNITSSNSNWSTTDVSIDIRTSNNAKSTITANLRAGLQITGTSFPNYVNYTGKKLRVYGTLELLSYDEKSKNSNVILGLVYKKRGLNEFTYIVSGAWDRIKKIPVSELLSNDNIINVDFEMTVPNGYSSGLSPWLINDLNASSDSNLSIKSNISYELIDDTDFKITSIIMPNGETVEYDGAVFSDIISKEGTTVNRYTVIDNRGKETSKTITIKIDKTAPILNLEYSTNPINHNLVVNINALDETSGVKRIKLPNGNYITNLNSIYTISGNGDYVFECEDVAGNITTKTISINNIDKDNPTVNIDKNNTDWTNKGVQININTRD